MLTIVTPVLNGRKFIQNTIDSIQQLTIPYEHIVVDGGSEDGTIEFVKQYIDIKLIHQTEKNGMYGAIHQGFLESKGEYLTWVNADDVILPKGYAKLYETALHSSSDLIVSNGIYHFIDKQKYKFVSALPFVRYFLKQGIFPFVQPSSIFSRKAYFKVGGFNYLEFRIIGDRDLFQKIAYDPDLSISRVSTTSSVFLRYGNSLLYRNLELLKKEHAFTMKTNPSVFNRTLYHTFRLLGSFKNKITFK